MTWKEDVQAFLSKEKAENVPADTSEPAVVRAADKEKVNDGTTALPTESATRLPKPVQTQDYSMLLPGFTSQTNRASSSASSLMSRDPSASSGIARYKDKLRNVIPAGQFDIGKQAKYYMMCFCRF